MAADPKEPKPLGDSLERLEEALARSRETEVLAASSSSEAIVPARSSVSLVRPLGVPLMATSRSRRRSRQTAAYC